MASQAEASILDRARRRSADRALLLYAGSCPKCRWMARAIILLSAGQIEGVALDKPEWRRFYDEELPESRGSPVLVRAGIPIWGRRVFPVTLWLALRGALGRRG
jgi:hypothetical protein